MTKAMLIAAAAALLLPATAHAATTSADLEATAKLLESNQANNATLNSRLLSQLREPAKTLDGITLPTTAAQYTGNVETALKLRPGGWIYGVREQHPPASMGTKCTAMLSWWVTNDPQPGLRMETFAWGTGNCPSVLSAAIARAWAFRLQLVGR